MKLHLPIKLLAAVIATFSVGMTDAAAYYDSINDIIYVASGETQQFIPTAQAPTSSYAVAKDGEGTLTFTGTGTMYETLYVREGEVQFGDGTTETSIRFTPIKNGAEGRYTAMGVAGKDAVVRFNKANVTCNETANFVGGLDGNGKMIIENESHVDFAGSNVFVIGDMAEEEALDPETGVPDGYNNSTTALPGASVDTGDNRYHGNYTPCPNGSDYTMGRGEVLVTGGSYFRATYGNFWIINGSLTVEGEGTVADIGLPGYGYRFWMGPGCANTESNMYVKNGAEATIYMSQMYMGYGDNSSALLEVDNASLTIAGGSGTQFFIGYSAKNQGSAIVNVINGGSFNIGSESTIVGDDSNSGKVDSQINVDKDSSLSADYVTLYKGAKVTNEGSFNATVLMLNDGELNNSGSLSAEDIWVESRVTNTGNIHADYVSILDKGELTLTQNAGTISASCVEVNSGGKIVFNVSETSSSNAAITLIDGMYGQVLDLYEDSIVDLVFDEGCLIDTETTVNIWLAEGAVDGAELSSTITTSGLDSTFWDTSSLAWNTNGSSVYIFGTIISKTEVELNGTLSDSDIGDNAAGDSVSVDITNDITLSGDNSYSGGTNVTDADVTLGSSSALGTGGVTTNGTTSLTATEGLVADVKGDIAVNSGELTMTGDFNVEGAIDNNSSLSMEGDVTMSDSVTNKGNMSWNGNVTADGSISNESLLSMAGNTTVNGSINNEGTLYVSGDATLNNDITNSGEISLDGNIATTGNITNNGTLSLSGSTAISNTITNNGLLNLNGTVDASGITKDTVNETSIDTDGLTGENGFKRDEGSSITLANNGENALIGTGTDLVVKHNGTTYEFDSTTGVAYAHGQIHHGVYFINTEDHEVSTSQIDAAGNNQTEKVVMQNGTLNADSDVTLQASGGKLTTQHGTVSGTIADTTIVSEGGTIAASVSGSTLNLTAGEVSGDISGSDITANEDALISGNVTGSTLNLAGGEISGKVTDSAITATGGSISGEISGGSIDAKAGEISGSISNATIAANGATISGDVTGGTLALTTGEVSGKVTDTAISATGGCISGEIAGKSTLEVTGETTLTGKNTLSGDTIIKGESAQLVLGAGSSLGTGKVQLDDHGTLDLGGNAISNEINVTGCTIAGACAYSGTMNVSGNLELLDATSAGKVVMTGNGSIKGAPLTTTELVSKTDGAATIDSSVNINKKGALTLSNGKDLNVSGNLVLGEGSTITLTNGNCVNVGGSLTLGAGTTIILNGDYAIGDELLISKTGSITMGDIKLQFADKTVEVVAIDGALTIVSLFKQPVAEAQVLANWGTMTASRVFVDAVRGQRTNTGCIANGRGTAWAAALGASHEIGSGDITLMGAAAGADMKIGRSSSVGVAIGCIDGDAEPAGLRKVEQESTYIALYGEHGLKKLSNTSCLSLDWTAAYGNTESEQGALSWEQQSVQLNTRLSWNKKINQRLSVSAFGGVEYFANESDRTAGIKTGSIQNLRGELGVSARYVAWGTPSVTDGKFGLTKPGCEKLVLNGTVRYMNDMVRSNPVVEMNGLRGMGENPGRQGVGIEAGATYRVNDRWSASANYGFNTMDDSKEHRLNVGASYTF